MRRNRGRQRGESVAAYGEIPMAAVIPATPSLTKHLLGVDNALRTGHDRHTISQRASAAARASAADRRPPCTTGRANDVARHPPAAACGSGPRCRTATSAINRSTRPPESDEPHARHRGRLHGTSQGRLGTTSGTSSESQDVPGRPATHRNSGELARATGSSRRKASATSAASSARGAKC
jgi:hypothetical protein